MDGFLNTIQGTFPDISMLRSKAYANGSIAVIETNFLPPGECVCGQFHFLFPQRGAPKIALGGTHFLLHSGAVLPCNPYQCHCAENPGLPDFEAIVLYVDNVLLAGTAEELYGGRDLEYHKSIFICTPLLKSLINTFILECRSGRPGYELMLDSLALQIVVTLLRDGRHNYSNSLYSGRDYCDVASILKAIEYLHDQFLNKITLAELAKETNYSPYHFLRLFEKHTGKSPIAYLQDLKIEKAKKMLRETEYSIGQVCDLCGFGSLSGFSRSFKKSVGLSPTEYRSQ